MASTAADLHAAAVKHAFSSSLYYYLNVVQIQVPPLRYRPPDIRLLAERYLALANAMRSDQCGKAPCRFTEEAWQSLLGYDWPGNTLQLESIVVHAVLMADGEEIGRATIAQSLSEVVHEGSPDRISVPLVGGLKEIERLGDRRRGRTLPGEQGGRRALLRLHRRTLYRMLQGETCPKSDAGPVTFALPAGVDACTSNQYE